jgi:hypothetical protein
MEEEKEKEEKNIFIYLLIYGILGGIIGGIIFYLFKPNFLYILLGFFLGIVLGLIFFGISSLPEENRKAAYTIFFLAIIVVILFLFIKKFSLFFPFNLKAIGSSFSNLFAWFSCLTGKPECPALEIEKNEVSVPDFSLSLEYERDYIKDNTIDMFVKIILRNKKIENLTMYPYCYKGEKESLNVYGLQDYSYDSHFVFPILENIVTGFWCRGKTNFQKEEITIGFDVPYSTNLYWTIYVSENKAERKEGILQKKELPYLLFLDTPFDMPLKNGKYNFFVKLKENPGYGFNLREIEKIEFSSSPDTNVYCEIELKQMKEEDLKEYYDENKKEYSFPCQLIISNAPSNVIEPRYINIDVSYKVYKEFRHVVREK